MRALAGRAHSDDTACIRSVKARGQDEVQLSHRMTRGMGPALFFCECVAPFVVWKQSDKSSELMPIY